MAWVNMNTCGTSRQQTRPPPSLRHANAKHQNQSQSQNQNQHPHSAENGHGHGHGHGHSDEKGAIGGPATALSMFVSDIFAVAAAPIDQTKSTTPTLIKLHRNDPHVAWGFRLQGGAEYKTQLAIKMVKANTPASQSLSGGDLIVSINGRSSKGLTHDDATEIIKNSGTSLSLEVIKTIASLNPGGLQRAAAAK